MTRSRYTRVEELIIKPNPRGAKDPRLAMEDEGRRVAAAIPSDSHVVLLDEKGKKLTSPGLAELLTRVSASGAPRIAFLIGGPHGHGPAARQRAHETVRLSDMVLNHQVAHIVLLEQLYRAWTILRGVPYHHI